MVSATADSDRPDTESTPSVLPFPPLTTSHILACSYHSWYPLFRSHSPKARLILLSSPFLDYLRADGIVLPPEEGESNSNSGNFGYDDDDDDDRHSHSSSGSTSTNSNDSDNHHNQDEDDDDDQDQNQDTNSDPSQSWPEVHLAISSAIYSLDGSVVPKLNWSAPKDAVWINPTNDMTCRTANDVYLLLKSSDFITHDLEHAFDDCIDAARTSTGADADADATTPESAIPYHLILRKKFQINPALEFRCFVRNRHLLAVSQRDMNYYDFLFENDLAVPRRFKALITTFLHDVILPKFHEPNFVFDVFISSQTPSLSRSELKERVWLIDINPWAQRTDPLLFSWLELLTMPGADTEGGGEDEDGSEPEAESGSDKEVDGDEQVIRIPFRPVSSTEGPDSTAAATATNTETHTPHKDRDKDGDVMTAIFDPEFRLVRRDDPEAYSFASAKYSAHKLPKDVVDASMTPSAMISMMEEWRYARQRGLA